jgi:3-oxoacyl-[acyl-carrier-protein] synthase-3
MHRAGVTIDDIGLVVPHQANLRIIDAVAKRAVASADKVFLTVQKYGNMSSATAPVALVEAVEEGRVAPNSLVLMPAFGGGLTLSAHLVRWGERLTPLSVSDAELPPPTNTALDIVNEIRAQKKLGEAEAVLFKTLAFPENRTG